MARAELLHFSTTKDGIKPELFFRFYAARTDYLLNTHIWIYPLYKFIAVNAVAQVLYRRRRLNP